MARRDVVAIAEPHWHTQPPERLAIREAMIDVVLERGYGETTVEEVIERAGVRRADFFRYYDGKQDCCLRLFLEHVAEFDCLVTEAAAEHDSWRDSLRAVGYATGRHVRDRLPEARFDYLHMLEVGEIAQAHRDAYMERFVDLIDAGRQELDDPESMSRDVAVEVLGSVHRLLTKMLHEGADMSSVDETAPGLMYLVTRPYIGEEAAREELTIPPPPDPALAGGS
jgi:AcrR family transcriptional regulator